MTLDCDCREKTGRADRDKEYPLFKVSNSVYRMFPSDISCNGDKCPDCMSARLFSSIHPCLALAGDAAAAVNSRGRELRKISPKRDSTSHLCALCLEPSNLLLRYVACLELALLAPSPIQSLCRRDENVSVLLHDSADGHRLRHGSFNRRWTLLRAALPGCQISPKGGD